MTHPIHVVVDANILFGAILKQEGKTNSILFSPLMRFSVPDFLFDELQKYETLFQKKGFLYREYVMNFLARDIAVYPTQFMEHDIIAIQDMMNNIDPKDTVYVALARKLNIPLRTNDKKLKEEISSGISIWNTQEVMTLLGI